MQSIIIDEIQIQYENKRQAALECTEFTLKTEDKIILCGREAKLDLIAGRVCHSSQEGLSQIGETKRSDKT